MYRQESDRRFRQQEASTFYRSLRSEGKEKSEISRTERKQGKTELEEEHLQATGKETSFISDRTLAIKSRGPHRRDGLFFVHKIKRLMDELLEEKLDNEVYDEESCKIKCLTLSEEIKQKVKELGMTRYRIICHVSIGSCSGQGLIMASRFIWNDIKDNFVTSTFRNVSLFAVATVFGVLKE
ncbi:tctex1 domain-containing protein 1-like [Actinia tenebrosa]|uniref:Tctex1 domain-containing protein 1-like n=1 Tax=Actinia tenebrosa TaxID=6105 RepID=A0A6P8I2W1_ACTTE|nr:tctex1 domain-containing protein 1-like [Actinia tenebrosa]